MFMFDWQTLYINCLNFQLDLYPMMVQVIRQCSVSWIFFSTGCLTRYIRQCWIKTTTLFLVLTHQPLWFLGIWNVLHYNTNYFNFWRFCVFTLNLNDDCNFYSILAEHKVSFLQNNCASIFPCNFIFIHFLSTFTAYTENVMIVWKFHMRNFCTQIFNSLNIQQIDKKAM